MIQNLKEIKIMTVIKKIKAFKDNLINKLSEKQKYELVNLILISIGLLVFTLRCLAIIELWNTPTFYIFNTYIKQEEELGRIGILHTSNFISIFTAIALMLRLRNSFINAVVIVAFPLIAIICVTDVAAFFIQLGQGGISLNTISIHLPTTLLGIYILFHMKERINLENFTIAVLVIFIWGFIVDTPRFAIALVARGFLILFVTIVYIGIVTILLIKFKAYRGLLCPPVYEIKKKEKNEFENKE